MKNLQDINELKQFGSLNFLARQVAEGFITGLHKSPYYGFSVEFAEHRAYNSGESIKDVDWKLYGRTDKMFVKKFEEETNLRCNILIDTSSSMHFPYKDKNLQSKLDFSVVSAAALIYLFQRQRDASSLTFISEDVEWQSQAKMSSLHINHLIGKLSEYLNQSPRLNRTANISEVLHYLAEKFHKRSLVILFSDLFGQENLDEFFDALRHLRHRKHEVLIFHVSDHRHEKEFEYKNRPYKFVDMETGETLKLNPNVIRNGFLNTTKDFFEEIKLRTAQHKIDLISADVNSDFRDVLLPYLIKRSKLH